MTLRFLSGVTLGWPSDSILLGMKERLAWLQNSAFQSVCFYFYEARKDLLYFIVLLTHPAIPRSQLISTFGVDGIGNITAVLNHYGSFLGYPLCQRRNQNSRVSRKIFVLHGKRICSERLPKYFARPPDASNLEEDDLERTLYWSWLPSGNGDAPINILHLLGTPNEVRDVISGVN